MKKLLLLITLFAGIFTFSQVIVTSNNKDLNEVYKGGKKQLMQDLRQNFRAFSADYGINGKFVITFDLDKDGKITNAKVFPEQVDDAFSFAFIRTFKRVKNNFNTEMPTKDLAVTMDFSVKDRYENRTPSKTYHEKR
ncbi:hypothetical protein [Halpernia sp. GG3]